MIVWTCPIVIDGKHIGVWFLYIQYFQQIGMTDVEKSSQCAKQQVDVVRVRKRQFVDVMLFLQYKQCLLQKNRPVCDRPGI